MKYQSKSDLPETLQSTLPDEAQTIYIDTYNSALQNDTPTPGGDLSQEAAAHAVAWQAVERGFEKSASDGKWYRRGYAPSEEEAENGLFDRIKNLF